MVEVLLDRFGEGQVALDAVETGGEHHGEGEVGVAGGVGAAELNPGGGGVTAADGRDANERFNRLRNSAFLGGLRNRREASGRGRARGSDLGVIGVRDRSGE